MGLMITFSAMSVLRSAARRGLAAFGLAPASHVSHLQHRVESAERRAEQGKQAIAEARDAATRWKARASELEEQVRKNARLAERLAKAERELQQVTARDEKHLGQLKEVRERMERAEKAVALSREHLMATETKLDIVEAAIHVLDTRTRG